MSTPDNTHPAAEDAETCECGAEVVTEADIDREDGIEAVQAVLFAAALAMVLWLVTRETAGGWTTPSLVGLGVIAGTAISPVLTLLSVAFHATRRAVIRK
ncbi:MULTISPECIES: hypothetical protein [Prauserella salsuginis group]|uniref:Uncharacterized protein n=1 Tax=Prauserella salsuginis TaxID=387889 RepID=A0ABW6G274_9PSEU|nr:MULTISPECIES: hypothetical protein [Prauserella salsuginis group]MCR3719924.1 hypothetical protein [Prauserella flava]MCR3736532.1 hypothetical protein [Prauserella salsuginis]